MDSKRVRHPFAWTARWAGACALLACLAFGSQHARSAELDLPELANASSVTVEVLDALLKNGVAIDGTVYAAITITNAGTKTEAYYGGPMSDPRAAAFVRHITETLRFTPSADWLKRHPDRHWSVFWMFQRNGCEPPIYDYPRDTTAIRVCLDVRDGRFDPSTTRLSFELPQDAFLVDEIVQAEPRVSCFYPYNDRTAGIEGATVLLVHVDAQGRADPRMVLQSAGSSSLDDATKN